jgi:o-succinylbenzoate synthase
LEGIGDTCPFPDFGSESFDEAESVLKNLRLKLEIDLNNIAGSLNIILAQFEKTPAVRHGIEQAVLNLICKEKRTTINELLNIKLKNEIDVNGTIGFNPVEETIRLAKELTSQGFKTLKIKCGRDDFKEEYDCLVAIRTEAGSEIKLRIDVNGKWNINQAIHNLKAVESLELEYAEQPVSNLNDMKELKNNCRIPIAADESVRSKDDAKKIINKNAADILILKPMMIGGLLPTLEIIDLAQKNKVDCVVTTSFESAIGRTNAVIAASCTQNNMAHGLSVNNLFTKDLIGDQFPVHAGKIKLN